MSVRKWSSEDPKKQENTEPKEEVKKSTNKKLKK